MCPWNQRMTDQHCHLWLPFQTGIFYWYCPADTNTYVAPTAVGGLILTSPHCLQHHQACLHMGLHLHCWVQSTNQSLCRWHWQHPLHQQIRYSYKINIFFPICTILADSLTRVELNRLTLWIDESSPRLAQSVSALMLNLQLRQRLPNENNMLTSDKISSAVTSFTVLDGLSRYASTISHDLPLPNREPIRKFCMAVTFCEDPFCC
jgi:hypothetical protein